LQQASDFGFGANRVAQGDKPYAAFDSVHMIQLHGQHALPKPISYLVTCFNALPFSLANQWQIAWHFAFVFIMHGSKKCARNGYNELELSKPYDALSF
jgi:hypothetical protein